jgi:hypothetical protein
MKENRKIPERHRKGKKEREPDDNQEENPNG